MKTIIAGGREFDNIALLCDTLERYTNTITEVVCGEAPGADKMGKVWALANDIPIKSFPADWDKHGRAAGPIRNKEMAEYADALVAFWDGESRGTKNMIEEAKKRGIFVLVVHY